MGFAVPPNPSQSGVIQTPAVYSLRHGSVVPVLRLWFQTHSQGQSLVGQTPRPPLPSLAALSPRAVLPTSSGTAREQHLQLASQEMLPEHLERKEDWALVLLPGREFIWKTTEADSGGSPVLLVWSWPPFSAAQEPHAIVTSENCFFPGE